MLQFNKNIISKGDIMSFENNAVDSVKLVIARNIINKILNDLPKLKKRPINEVECYLKKVDELLIKEGFSEEEINFIWIQTKNILEEINKTNYNKSYSEAIPLIQTRTGTKKDDDENE